MYILSVCGGNEIDADNATLNTTVEQNRANAIVDTICLEEFTEKLIPEGRNITINEDTLYIGKI